MRYLLYIFFLTSLISCTEKDCALPAINTADLIDSVNKRLLKANSYFGIDSIRKPFFKDTVDALDPDAKKRFPYASVTYYIHFDTVYTRMRIELYTNVEAKEITGLRDLFFMIKAYENVSAYIELKNFFCTIILDDRLGNETLIYLKNVKIALLEKYIALLSRKPVLHYIQHIRFK